ncbi:MAG: imidazolonepropionase [Bacteroidota bacterium]
MIFSGKDLLIRNIGELFQVTDGSTPVAGTSMANVPSVKGAYLLIRNGLIKSFGPDEAAPPFDGVVIDANGGLVLPAFVDCHTHIIFPASREDEFVMKIRGMDYAAIAKMGGGILNSARKLREISEDELLNRSRVRLHEVMSMGTGAIEIKSGYGLDTEGELKMLRVADKLRAETGIPVRRTFLGAHAIPVGITRQAYIRLIVDEMLPAITDAKLADDMDVFCEEGFFTPDETVELLEAGRRFGLMPRVHANQLSRSGGVQAGVRCSALSVDHLEQIGDEEIAILKDSDTMPVALPGAAFFLNLPFPPARRMLEEGLPLAIASDYNPGSAPSGNLMLMWSLACIKMKMTPEEALNALTINAACSLQLQHRAGSIAEGKVGSVIITDPVPSLAYLPYHVGMKSIRNVVINGSIL